MNNGRYSVGNGDGPVEIRISVGARSSDSASYDGLYARLGDLIRSQNPYGDAVLGDHIAYEPYGRAKDKNAAQPLSAGELERFDKPADDITKAADYLERRALSQICDLYRIALEMAPDGRTAADLVRMTLERASADVSGYLAKKEPELQALKASGASKPGIGSAPPRLDNGQRRMRWTVEDRTYNVNKALVVPYKYEGADRKERQGFVLIGYQGGDGP